MELFSIRIQRTFQLVSTERGGRDVFSVVFLFEGYENHRIFPGKPSE